MTAPGRSDWDSALNDVEARLDACRDGMAAGDPPTLPPFQPPTALPPMPDAVVQRATELLERGHSLERMVAQTIAAMGDKLASMRAAAPPSDAPRRRSGRLDISM